MKIYKGLIVILCLVFIAFSGNAHAANLSQSSVSLAVGQSTTVYAYNVSTYLYISNNYNPSVATVSINGNNILIYGNSNGSTTATICENNNYSCNTLYITVTGYYNNYNNYNYNNYGYGYNNSTNMLGLNISNLNLSTGDSITISPSNLGSGGMYVSSNSNPSVASVSYSLFAPGCTATSLYSFLTGQPCVGAMNYNYNNNYNYNYNVGLPYYPNSYVPGCTGTSMYSYLTGQPCNAGGYNQTANNTSLVISALAIGSDTITVCQNNSNLCNSIYLSVIR
ncbi:MAG: hypothetical protein KGL67_02210 [Patescibacteria group bacterium]|nr:hypothetical protein [Patescibacteria group bacterium]